MVAEIKYINEDGLECSAVLLDADRIDHIWWSSKKNLFGKYEKHEVTVFQAFLDKIRGCTGVRVKVYDNRR